MTDTGDYERESRLQEQLRQLLEDCRHAGGSATFPPLAAESVPETMEGHRQGGAEAPCIFKWSGLGTLAPAEAASGQEDSHRSNGSSMTFVASTEEVDRHGDVIAVGGWRLEAYRKNPVFLWAHDYARPAIGRSVKVWTTQGEAGLGPALLVEVEFAPTAFAQEVAALYRGGYQKGVSVGFRPLRYEERRHPQTGQFLGLRFTEQALLEVSAAPVPANENAVRRAGTPWPHDWASPAGMEARLAHLERQVKDLTARPSASALPSLMEALQGARAGFQLPAPAESPSKHSPA